MNISVSFLVLCRLSFAIFVILEPKFTMIPVPLGTQSSNMYCSRNMKSFDAVQRHTSTSTCAMTSWNCSVQPIRAVFLKPFLLVTGTQISMLYSEMTHRLSEQRLITVIPSLDHRCMWTPHTPHFLICEIISATTITCSILPGLKRSNIAYDEDDDRIWQSHFQSYFHANKLRVKTF